MTWKTKQSKCNFLEIWSVHQRNTMFLWGIFRGNKKHTQVKTVADDLSNKKQVIFNISSNYSFMLVCLSSRLFMWEFLRTAQKLLGCFLKCELMLFVRDLFKVWSLVRSSAGLRAEPPAVTWGHSHDGRNHRMFLFRHTQYSLML